jgi:ectoine hydroxylase-related dioxygenase (phytanoyl-CoA dioxygenase family)
VEPDGVRGIYCTLPYRDHEGGPDRCHVDAHPFHLGVVGYIDDVAPSGGGFRVWPGSHRTFYPDFESAYRMEPTASYEVHRARLDGMPSIDCFGHAGDVVFWHHRLGHMAAHNHTRHIRQAVLYDFRKKDLAQQQEAPPAGDMWQDWSPAVQKAAVDGTPP